MRDFRHLWILTFELLSIKRGGSHGDLKRFLVPWIDQVKPYDTEDLLIAWSRPELKRMMINENPLPPSEKVLQAIVEAAKMGNRYPDNGPRLRAKIAKRYDLGPENVYLSHGSSEIIDMIMRLFVTPGDEVLLPNPTFSLYGIRARAVGGNGGGGGYDPGSPVRCSRHAPGDHAADQGDHCLHPEQSDGGLHLRMTT